MKINHLRLEYPGIYTTITRYTKNPYIVGYLKIMNESINDKNIDDINSCIQKLLSWYETNIKKILANEYVMNKEDHIRTRKILTNAYDTLN